jgi:hypothetical protein
MGQDWAINNIVNSAKQQFKQKMPYGGLDEEQFTKSIVFSITRGVAYVMYEKFLNDELKRNSTGTKNQNVTKKKRVNIPPKTKRLLQKEINSICPFCPSSDVDHFEYHHIDGNPSNNEFGNLLMVCPTCHSKIEKADITKDAVFQKKYSLNNNKGVTNFNRLFISKDGFQTEFKNIITQTNSHYYTELKDHWNSYSLRSDCPFLNSIMVDSLSKSIEYGLLPLMSDAVSNHLYYDKEAKYIYNQPHVYMHNSEDEGRNLPVYYHIRFIGILYSTAIQNKVDIDTVAKWNKNMQSIYSSMVKAMIDNLATDGVDNSKEYPTNYHWLIGEIFSIINNWLNRFNEKDKFINSYSYVDFIPSNFRYCLSELYSGVTKNKIDQRFVVSQCYYGVLTEYFSPLLNDDLRGSIEENVITEIPNELIEPLFQFALDEKFALDFENLISKRFGFLADREKKILNRLRDFLVSKNKI